ncbi:hypothetical protein FJZ28_02210 [Candidatus Peregrinibacteria bacterium]|nr:hypothetical protein [Candidatus Peregrinibacteria bacterium]
MVGLWYFYYHGDELLSKVAEEAAKQAAAVTEKGAGSMMEQFQKYLPK